MKTYYFSNSSGTVFCGEFKSIDEAKRFAYRAGLCFLGSC